MSVRVRLGLTFIAIIAVFLVPIRYAGGRLSDLRELAVERRSQHAAATLALGEFRAALTDYDSHQRAYLVTLEPQTGREVEEALAALEEQIGGLEAAGYADVTQGLSDALDSLEVASERIDSLIRADQVEEATWAFDGVQPLMTTMAGELETIAAAVDQRSAADFARAEEMSATAATTTIIATLVVALLAIIMSVWTTHALTGPLGKLSKAAAQVEAGAFEEPEDLPYHRGDEIGDLSRSFRAMTRRLAQLDRMKAEFMSVASHELKTPIHVITGYSELLEEELESPTERQREILEAISEQTHAMTRLASRLLDIGRLEAGTYRMEFETVHVQDVLHGLTRSFEPLAREREIRLVMKAESSAPATIRVDPDMLRNEVLGNLVSNALRFTPPDGEIRVRVWQEADEVVFEVSDTGPGIPEEQRPHIFEKYYEGGRTRFMGAGLGLAVAKQVTKAHGGRITLEPPGDEGATFRVYLPVAGPPEPGVQVDPGAAAEAS